MYYVQKDYLGSYYSITDERGDIVLLHDREEQVFSFDSWGRRRKPNNWAYYTTPTTYLFDRGFTGHEHLDNFDLINMNGRVYDPWLGRFLSPDPFVQAPDYSQNFNRYSYALNNPLKYTDPSGEWINFVIGAGIGGVVGYISGRTAGLREWNLTYYTIASAAIGAISSGVGTVASSAVSISAGGFVSGAVSGAVGGFAGGFVAGFYTTGLNNVMFGQNNNVLLGGLKGGAIGAAGGFFIGGISGGIYAENHDGNFWTGKGMILESTAQDGLTPQNVKIGEGMKYTTAYATDIADKTYGKLSYVESIATNEVPLGKGYTLNNGCIINKSGEMANGLTKYLGKGMSEVYLGKSAFTSIYQLQLSIGHEYIHATQNYMFAMNVLKNINLKIGDVPMKEVAAYNWESTMGVSNGYDIWTGRLGAFSWSRQPYYNWLLNANF